MIKYRCEKNSEITHDEHRIESDMQLKKDRGLGGMYHQNIYKQKIYIANRDHLALMDVLMKTCQNVGCEDSVC